MFVRIRIAGYKTFENAEARLGPLTVVLGPLGSGRTNLLEAISLLGRLALVERLERAFAPPHRGRAGEVVRGPAFKLEADLELNPRIVKALNARLAEREKLEGLEGSFTRVAERRLRYAVACDLSPDSGALRLVDESLEPLTASGAPRGGRKPFFERDQAHGRFVVRLERQGRVRYFGVGRRRTLLSEVTDLVYHPHPAAAREEMLGIRRFAFEASALRAPAGGSPADQPGFRGEDFAAFLHRLAAEEPDALRRVEEKLAPVGLDGVDLNGPAGTPTLRMRGERLPLHLAPDGVLRLLAIAGVLECGASPTLVLLDEPESGLDPAALAALARVLRMAATGRRPATQVILVTTSLELAALVDPAAVIVCRREPGRGSVLETLPGDIESLFRRGAMERALRGLSGGGPGSAAPAARGRRRATRG